jgi:hypothetical protein
MLRKRFSLAGLIVSLFLISGGLSAWAQRPSAIVEAEQLNTTVVPYSSLSTTTSPPGFQKGASLTAWYSGVYSMDDTAWVIDEQIRGIGANWIAVVVQCYQETATSTQINCDTDMVPTDAELTHVIQVAHANGLHVMLKPHIALSNDPDHWRGQIDFGDDETQWAAWFSSYTDFILHYAQLAQSLQVEQFCVGTELYDSWQGIGPARRTSDWRNVIAQVRQTYSGALTYAANHSGEETFVQFWDDLDYIGVDAYYYLTDLQHPSVNDLIAAWDGPFYTLQQLAQTWNRPIIFTEIGYNSSEGATASPASWPTGPLDLEVQANAYEAVFQKFGNQTWWGGVYWWNWDPNYLQGGLYDLSFVPSGKPAEDVLRYYYSAEIPLQNRGFHVVYDDSLASPWQDWSFLSTVNWYSTEVVHSGATAIAADLGAWGAVSVHSTQLLDTGPYGYLEFYINGGPVGGQRLHVNFNSANIFLSNAILGNYTRYAVLPPNEWLVVRIPISDLNRSGALIDQVTIKNFSPDPAARIYIDGIRFVQKSLPVLIDGAYLPLVLREYGAIR